MGCSCSLQSSETILSVGVKSKLEVRLSFADQASRNKVFRIQRVSFHASRYINSAAARNDTIEHLLYWLVSRLQVEYHQHAAYSDPAFVVSS